jgi:hypothetical protein
MGILTLQYYGKECKAEVNVSQINEIAKDLPSILLPPPHDSTSVDRQFGDNPIRLVL